ncbi:LuxR family transcriptional regulator [Streptomyces griseoviridis]|uniref:LuxR family transcriptional regulator n=1 Tax=Streptomyces griseoviridis TaxID=45398 RepID=A0A3Q9KY47_STRGD|nr:AAA family ATPase [Streptomyces griseoviridis]AZS88705.1 LuxR family transcriptional regulator [Streptomyces griseoviridis]QCN84456.1 LuxR family transcriptional regulator [Streptomyces griseoviridis]
MPSPEFPLLERDREQAVLSAMIGELRSARPAVVTVTGEPGLGQNALLRWAAEQATSAGLRVLTARATPAEDQLRYGVVAQLLTGEDRDLAPRLFLSQDQSGGLPGLGGLLTAARDRPTLLVVQDVQWLDVASLRWLEALVRRLPRVPLALLTSSTGAAITRPEWSVGTSLTSVVSTIELALPPLTASGTADAVRAVCGTPGAPAFTAAVADATRGNPAVLHDALERFTREGHRPLAESVGQLRALTAEVVGDHAAKALSELRDPAAVDALRALAVCGDLLDFPLVCGLAGPHAVPEARLRAALQASGLTTLKDGAPYIPDSVVRARVLEEMPAADRADLHARAARLAQRVAADDQGIADLLMLARPVGAPWAVDTLRRGYTAALRGGDRDRAAGYLARALDEPLDAETRARVEYQLASVEMLSVPAAAERRLHGLIRTPGTGLRSRAVDLCLLGGDTRSARLALAESGDLSALPGDGVPSRRPHRGRPDAAPLTPPKSPGTHAAAHCTTDTPAGAGQGTGPTVAEQHEMAALLRIGDCLRHDGTELDILPTPALPDHSHSPAVAGLRAWQHAVAGAHIDEARRLGRAALAPDPAGRPPLVVPRLFACRALLLTDDGDEVESHLAEMLSEAHRERSSLAVAHILSVRADLHIRHGRPDAASRDLAAAEVELPPAGRHPLFMPYWIALSVISDIQRGHIDRAAETVARPVPRLAQECATTAYLLFAQGALAHVRDEPYQAREYFRAAGRWLLRFGCVNPAEVPWRSFAAETAHILGAGDEAQRLAREELSLARRWGASSPLGRAELGLAMVVADQRVEHLRAAVATLSEAPARTDYTRAVIELASAERDEADRRSVVSLNAAGSILPGDIAATLRTDTSARDATARHQATTAPHPTPRQDTRVPAAWRGLSDAEREAAVLATRGLGNREIATILSVTTRTVELRLSGVYRKLRIRGREELRALAQGSEGS